MGKTIRSVLRWSVFGAVVVLAVAYPMMNTAVHAPGGGLGPVPADPFHAAGAAASTVVFAVIAAVALLYLMFAVPAWLAVEVAVGVAGWLHARVERKDRMEMMRSRRNAGGNGP